MEETIFAVRNVDLGTRKFVQEYAHEHDLNTGEALREIIVKAKERIREERTKKKHNSIFDTWEKIKFKGPGDASENIDEILYGEGY